MMKNRIRANIYWAIEKRRIEQDIQEDHGQRLLNGMKEIDEKEPLSTKQKLTLLNLYMRSCTATCLIHEFCTIQLKCSIGEQAKEECLNNRMLNTMLIDALRGDNQ